MYEHDPNPCADGHSWRLMTVVTEPGGRPGAGLVSVCRRCGTPGVEGSASGDTTRVALPPPPDC